MSVGLLIKRQTRRRGWWLSCRTLRSLSNGRVMNVKKLVVVVELKVEME